MGPRNALCRRKAVRGGGRRGFHLSRTHPGTACPVSPSSHSRFVGPEEEDLVLVGGGLDCSFWHLIDLCDTRDRVTGEGRDPWGSSDPPSGKENVIPRGFTHGAGEDSVTNRSSGCAHQGRGQRGSPARTPCPVSSCPAQPRHTQQIQALPPAWASNGDRGGLGEGTPRPKRGHQTRGQPGEGSGVRQQPLPNPRAGAAPASVNNPEAPSGNRAKATPAAFYSV